MTVKDLAVYLCVHMSTIHRMIARRELPMFKVGRDYRCRRSDIEAWMTERVKREKER